MTNPHIETLVNFLRDFAAANADSFAPEQIDYLNQAAVAINDLTERHVHMSNIALSSRAAVHQTHRDLAEANKERDSARWEVCELVGDGSIDSATRVAEERGWNLTEYFTNNFGYDPHAEEGKKRQEDYDADCRRRRVEGLPPF